MKRLCIFLLVAIFLISLSSCESSEEPKIEESNEVSEEVSVADTKAPEIKVQPNARSVEIKKGDEIDLMDGVSAYDKVDGNLTDKIVIDKGDFDNNKVGAYTVSFNLTDAAGNRATTRTKTIIVTETDILPQPELYSGTIEGEAQKPEPAPVFGGAWYHKVVSSEDAWVGIEATITLPEVKIRRYNADFNDTLNFDPNVKNLDNPSVYLGGNALFESDVGLSFSLGMTDAKSKTISKGSIVFRPFWRYITNKETDEGAYDAHGGKYSVSVTGNNCFANYHWSYTEYYYLPGDTLRIIVFSPEKDKLQLQIEVIEKSTLPESVEMREKYGWKDPENFFSPIFSSEGHGSNVKAEFKRVNAIDQSGNEGGKAIPTDTEVTNAVWHNTYLYRVIDGTLYRVPMDDSRSAKTDAPESDAFTVIDDDEESKNGGEIVSIHPNAAATK